MDISDQGTVTVITDVAPPCMDGGGSDDHVWIEYSDGTIGCRDCPEVLTPQRLLEVYTEYDRIVQTGIKILQGELEAYRADFHSAATDLRVSLDEMPPGSTARRLVIANRLLNNERNELVATKHRLTDVIKDAILMAENGHSLAEVAARLNCAFEEYE